MNRIQKRISTCYKLGIKKEIISRPLSFDNYIIIRKNLFLISRWNIHSLGESINRWFVYKNAFFYFYSICKSILSLFHLFCINATDSSPNLQQIKSLNDKVLLNACKVINDKNVKCCVGYMLQKQCRFIWLKSWIDSISKWQGF